MLEGLLTVGEVAKRLGLSSERVRQLADRGDLKMERGPRGMRFIPQREAERLAKERERERTAAGR